MSRSTLRHPITGHLLEPVGYRRDGRPIWPIMGGSEGGDAGTGGDAGGDEGGTPPEGDAGKDGDAGKGDPPPPEAGKVEDLPAWAQRALADARSDAGKARTTAKQQAAEEARQQMAQEIGKALGLVKGDDKPDPAKLAADLAEQQTAARQASVELAVFKSAVPAGADPAALLDSRDFLAKIAKLDPSTDGFDKALTAAVTAAVKENPQKFKATQAAAASGAEFTGGSGEGANKPKTLGSAIASHYAK
ncbi:MAG TPA: hypothetical protein VIQ30_22625 [Pseudonocardia sp.]